MATNYPTSLDDGTTLPEPTTGATIPALADTNRSQAIKAVQTKIGTGASTPTDGKVLTGTGTGTSAWEDPVAVEGTAIASTGEVGGNKFLREDGDGTSSWQAIPGGGDLLAANNLSDLANAATARTNLGVDAAGTDNAPAASTTTAGKVELATDGETTTGTDTTRATTPAGVKAVADLKQNILSEGAFVNGDKTKLDGIETAADVTDAANVASAGAVMASLADAKGDIFVASADNTVTRLAAGTNDQVLTADSAEATGLKWATPAAAGGGGNPYGADIVVAASGGDYTTLGAAIDAATAGQVIYVEAGTYVDTTNPATEADNVTIIGASKETAIIQINTAAWNLENVNLSIRNIKFEITSGSLTINSVGFDMANCWVYCSAAKTSGVGFLSGGDKSRVTNCLLESLGQGTSTSGGDFQFANCTVANNTFDTYATRTFGNIRSNGSSTYSGNYFWAKGGTAALFRTGANDSIIGNWFKGFSSGSGARAIVVGSGDCLVSSNNITRISKGIFVDGSNNCVVVGNQIDQDSGDTHGIEITGSSNCVISSNRVSLATTGIHITDAGSTSNLVMGNVLTGCTTGFTDSGTTTTAANNVGA